MITIPEKLKVENIRFILIGKKSKQPLEKNWNETTNYRFDDPRLLKHLENNGNYGILCGYENLIVIDADHADLIDYCDKNLPKTFNVITGSGKRHFYYRCEKNEKVVLNRIEESGNETHYGEIQGVGSQVVGANSIHPNGNNYEINEELNIVSLQEEDLNDLIVKFCSSLILKAKANNREEAKFDENNIESNINIINLLDPTKFAQTRKGYYVGAHPIHGSATGKNFHLDINNNIWYCFRCNSGGGIASLIAVIDKIVSCSECKGKLSKETYKNVLRLAEIKYGFKPKEKSTGVEETIRFFGDKLGLTEEFYKVQPYFYDKAKNFWFWSTSNFLYNRVDETDLLTGIKLRNSYLNTINSTEKGEIIEALKQCGRSKLCSEPKKSWIQFKDKILDFETGEILDANPSYFITNPIPWKMGESKETPELDKLLAEWVGEDYALTLKEILAVSTLTYLPLHRIFCFIGNGRNGKGTFIKLLNKFLGNYNVAAADLNRLLSSRFEIIKLYKKLVVVIGEIDKTIFKQSAILKALSGEDSLSAEYKGKDSIDFINYASPIILTNTLPETTDKTDGFFSRWCIVDFPNQFEEQTNPINRIPNSEFENFCNQIPDILKNLIERRRFWKEGDINERKKRYEEHSNPIDKFIEEYCKKEVDSFLQFSEFSSKLCEFLFNEGYRKQSDIEISKSLKSRGLEIITKSWSDIYGDHHNAKVILGVSLE